MADFVFATLRLGKTSVNDIKRINSKIGGAIKEKFSISVVCTQIPNDLTTGVVVFIWLGSDNSKGAPTEWKQGFKAMGRVTSVIRGEKYNDESTTNVDLFYIFPEAINRLDILREAADEYYWCSSMPVIGLDDHSNQTIRMLETGKLSDVNSFFAALNLVHKEFKKELIEIDPYFSPFFQSNHIKDNGNNSDDYTSDLVTLTPEWFKAKCQSFLYLDAEAASERDAFMKKYSPETLRELEGVTLLRTIFLNDENKDNLCYHLEFNKALRDIFGSIKSGTSYKYGLHYSQKNKSWATGSANKPQFLTEDEAVELGTQIRDYLILGCEIIKDYGEINSLEDYSKLYLELNEATDGYINKVWFLKYYQMIYPNIFPPIYSSNAQNTVLTAIGEHSGENPIIRMGQLQLFIRMCGISPVVFSRTFWANAKSMNDDSSDIREDTLVPIRFNTGLDIQIHRNRILFGAPGTGKSFTLKTEAAELLGDGNEEDYERVTFHPDYSYANFVGTYKPVPHKTESGEDSITYEYVPGPFMRVYVKALRNSQTDTIKPFLLIIEEINRANVAAVFGDVFQLLDRGDDNISEYPIQASEDIKAYLAKELGGRPDDYSKIRIPDNMFIWATMNSADQGVYPVDTAFKRRWDFTYLGIDDSEDGIKGKTVILGCGQYARVVEWNKLRKAINTELLTYKVNEDKLLGPYFIAKKSLPDGDIIEPVSFIRIFKNKVIMYLFEDAGKQRRPALFGGCEEASKNQYSKICKEFDEKGVFIFCEAISREFIEKPSEDVE